MKQIEKQWQQYLAKFYYPCDTEVKTPVGYIDVLSLTHLIEIKRATKWKHALGQVIAYHTYYPNHSMGLFLFGEIKLPELMQVHTICKGRKISLTISFDEEPAKHVIVRQGITISADKYDEEHPIKCNKDDFYEDF